MLIERLKTLYTGIKNQIKEMLPKTTKDTTLNIISTAYIGSGIYTISLMILLGIVALDNSVEVLIKNLVIPVFDSGNFLI